MLPARKTSKARKRKRRAHHAMLPVNLAKCPSCSHLRLPHAACTNCGYVNPRTKLELQEAQEA
jgi:large subunit ribosomal protein L32